MPHPRQPQGVTRHIEGLRERDASRCDAPEPWQRHRRDVGRDVDAAPYGADLCPAAGPPPVGARAGHDPAPGGFPPGADLLTAIRKGQIRPPVSRVRGPCGERPERRPTAYEAAVSAERPAPTPAAISFRCAMTVHAVLAVAATWPDVATIA